MILFSGSSNEPLAERVADILQIQLGKRELVRFADGEIRPWIQDDVRDQIVFVLQSFSLPMNDHIMEFVLMGDAILRGAPKRLVAIVPYFGYARQDKQHRPGESVSARVVAKMLEILPFHEVITVDLHNDAIVGFFRIPVTHLSAMPTIAERLGELPIDNNTVVVAPDVGGVKRARNLSQTLNLPLIVMEKKRNLDLTDKTEVYQIIGDVKGKTALLIDDMFATGGTIANAAIALKDAGAIGVIACATHGVMAGNAIEKLTHAPIDTILISDTISLPDNLPDKFHHITVAPIIAEAVKRVAGI